MPIKTSVLQKFEALSDRQPLLVNAPGRVNMIGEHTDYNAGLVLPVAVNRSLIFAIAENNEEVCRVYAQDLADEIEFSVENPEPLNKQYKQYKQYKQWANYVIGVVGELRKAGYFATNFDCVFGGNIPIGAGLSSSAALTAGLAFALNELYGFEIPKMELAKIAQKAENNFGGVDCGIMDFVASLFGKEGHAIRLDCRSLEHRYIKLRPEGYQLVLCDTQIKRSLAKSEYNARRNECKRVLSEYKRFYPDIQSLRDLTINMAYDYKNQLPDTLYQRCRYIIKENVRVEYACEDLINGDVYAFGAQMYLSHEGLQYDYEVSCRELNFLVEQTKRDENVAGARMTGAGFGGCTVNVVRDDYLDTFTENMKQAYRKKFSRELRVYPVKVTNGISIIDN